MKKSRESQKTVDTVEVEPSDDDLRAQFAIKFAAAVRRRDAESVCRLAKRAGAGRWGEAVRPLCDLLVPPTKKWRTPSHGRNGWSEARAAAVCALEQIGHHLGNRAIVRTLACDRDFCVRAAAAAALSRADSTAVESIVEAIREPIDWDADGMHSLLGTLGILSGLSDAQKRLAGLALVDVLHEQYPPAPRRWSRPAKSVARLAGLVTTIAVAVGSSQEGEVFLLSLLMAFLAGQFATFVVRAAATIVWTTANGRVERRHLNAAAADSLVSLNDRRSIPALLELAYSGPVSNGGGHARRVLRSLLTEVRQEDGALFSAASIATMNAALFRRPLDRDTVSALVKALGAVGNSSSLRPLRRIVKRGRTEAIRAAARRAVEAVEARETQANLAKTLLRGVAGPAAAPDQLLRAAAAHPSDRPEHLLRAACPDLNHREELTYSDHEDAAERAAPAIVGNGRPPTN